MHANHAYSIKGKDKKGDQVQQLEKATLRDIWSPEALEAMNEKLESYTPAEIVTWALNEFGPDITLACSFGGVSGMVLLDMALKVNPNVPVFYADTDFLFPETYAFKDASAKRYGFQPLGFKSTLTPEEQAAKYGDALWATDPDLCCELRKVKPAAEALKGHKAWIAGLRRDQGSSRRDIGILEWDDKYDVVKVNPLANWNEYQVREYLAVNKVAYNPLNDQGYPSLGCTHCTRQVKPGEDMRAGRWAGFDKTECGLHLPLTIEDEKPSFLSVLKNLIPGS